MRRLLSRLSTDLRVRIAVLLFVGVLMAGIGFDLLVIMLTEQRLLQELDHRARSYAGLLATRVSTPLLLHDRVGLREELMRAIREPDVIGVSVFDAKGAEFAREVHPLAEDLHMVGGRNRRCCRRDRAKGLLHVHKHGKERPDFLEAPEPV